MEKGDFFHAYVGAPAFPVRGTTCCVLCFDFLYSIPCISESITIECEGNVPHKGSKAYRPLSASSYCVPQFDRGFLGIFAAFLPLSL